MFLILVARAVAPTWEVRRSAKGAILNLEKKKAFINHYSFHIMDPEWGHVTIKMSGHPPFGAQLILNGHDYVACQARAAGINFGKEGNCFTTLTDAAGLARVADTLSLPAAVGRLSQVCDRWIYDHTLDALPLPARLGRTRVGGVDPNKPRMRAVLAAVLALTPAPDGFTVADVTAKVNATGRPAGAAYTARQAAYDLRKLRGKNLIVKPGRTRRYLTPPQAARVIAALLTLREHVIAPIVAGVRAPRQGRKPATWTRVDRRYEALRVDMHAMLNDLGITSRALAA